MFDPPLKLLLGLITGILFGFLLQKGRVAKFPVIVGQFLLRDFTVLKVMLSAVVVGAVGVTDWFLLTAVWQSGKLPMIWARPRPDLTRK